MTSRFRAAIMWAQLVLIVALMVMSIIGAFLGASRTQVLFNSLPLVVYWVAAAACLIAAIAAFPGLVRAPGLSAIHIGCILVLAGAMAGSEAGHNVLQRLFGKPKIRCGYMIITEGATEDRILAEDFEQQLGRLPFGIHLADFRIEYYRDDRPGGFVSVETPEGSIHKIPARPGQKFELPGSRTRITILRLFRNFRVNLDAGQKVITDQPGPAENPAAEVLIERADGAQIKRYVFELFAENRQAEDEFALSYVSAPILGVRDYISTVEVLKDGHTVRRADIEVNRPLHYGGYHLYQHSYDSQQGRYTILSVVCDTGLNAVYSGYGLLCAGMFSHFWLRAGLGRKKRKS